MIPLFVLFIFALAIASLVGTIWAAIEISTKPFVKENDKVLWLIMVLLLGGIGPVIYLTQRKKLLAEFQHPGKNDFERLDLGERFPQQEPIKNSWDEDLV